MSPTEDFEHLLMLTGFSLAGHSLRLLDRAGLLDDRARTVIRGQLEGLQQKIEAVPDGDRLLHYLDVLTELLPPTTRGGD